MPKKTLWPKPLQLWQVWKTITERPVGQTKSSCCQGRRAGLLRGKRIRHGDRSCGTMVACRQAGQFLARIVESVLLEGGRQSFTRPHASIVRDRHVEIGDCRGTADTACFPTVDHGGKCKVSAKCCEHVGQALGRCSAGSFHSSGYGGAIYTKPGLEREETSGDLGGEYRLSHFQSTGRRRRDDSSTDRLTGSTAASLATVGDLRLALGMKHPHDVIDQMDLDLAMSGVFRAVPLLPDSEKLGRSQVFTDGSAMLERAWPHRRTSAAWGAVLVQTNSQGLDERMLRHKGDLPTTQTDTNFIVMHLGETDYATGMSTTRSRNWI